MKRRRERSGLDLWRLDDLTPLVMTAVRTHAVGQLLLVAIGTNRQARLRQGVVRATLVSPGFGVAALGIGHGFSALPAIRLGIATIDP